MITGKGIKDFVSNQYPQLQQLILSYNNIGNDGLHLILEKLHKLSCLKIVSCFITSKGIMPIDNYNLSCLKHLSLQNNNIGSTGVKWLIKLNMPNLEHLEIVNCFIQGQGNRHLMKGIWNKLNSLSFGNFAYFNRQSNSLWQYINTASWKNLSTVIFYEKQPICWIGLACMQNQGSFIRKNCIFIHNLVFKYEIIQMLNSKNIRTQ